MIPRTQYVTEILCYKLTRLIKVLSGVRRSGKSTILQQLQSELKMSGVANNQIQSYNFEDPDFDSLKNWKELYEHIKDKLVPGKPNFIFLDEIQEVDKFERIVDGLHIIENVDIYITGSNAHFLSNELATLLSGRYIQFDILPFSFSEYISGFEDKSRLDLLFSKYLEYGSMPEVLNLLQSNIEPFKYLNGIIDTVLRKDVIARNSIRDVGKLDRVMKFLFSNTGSSVSSRSIANYLKNDGSSISNSTVEFYLKAFADALIFYKAERFDIRGKKLLTTLGKYYSVDTGVRNALLGRDAKADIGHLLENVVFLELKRRYSQVFVGKNDTKEIDFVVKNERGDTEYYQVSATVRDENTLMRELAAFKNIKEFAPAYLLTMDVDLETTYNGIRKINVIDWLLAKK